MDLARLNRRVTLQQRAAGSDDEGDPLGWEDVDTVWAGRQALRGGEKYAAQRINPELTWTYWLRYRAGVTPAMRLVDGGQPIEILSVTDLDDAHVWLELECQEWVGVSA